MTGLMPQTLTRESFAPFGDVVAIDGVAPDTINQGFAQSFGDLARVDTGDGQTRTRIFVANPRPQPVEIKLMERHPLGSQLFYPLQDKPWQILVCTDPLKPESYRLFSATGRQGVNYARNVWHHPLLVFDPGSRFIVIDRKGQGDNLEEVWLENSLYLATQ